MDTFKSFESELYAANAATFNEKAIRIFQFQYQNNPIYRQYCQFLKKDPSSVRTIYEIPYLPVGFFKSQHVKTGSWEAVKSFTSSATTGAIASQHLVKEEAFYLNNTVKNFEHFYGPLSDYHFIALLPSYLEREGSSLVAMADHFIKQSKSPHAGFYLYEVEQMISKVAQLRGGNRKVLLLGVTFALLDLAEKHPVDLDHCIIMETGGMKGRRPEITRSELHAILCDSFRVQSVHSEYGMTELFSQAYSSGNGLFQCPPWMRVVLRDPEDPLDYREGRLQGAINIIDLANIHSCAFIETQDLGRLHQSGYFEVLGRMDNSDIRGCNLLAG